jgi:hypothetical protein
MRDEIQVRDFRNGDWLWVSKIVIQTSLLSASTKIVYFALASFANSKSQKCYPSTNNIARMVKITQPTVIKALKDLIKYKLIAIEYRKGKVNIYSLLKVNHLKSLGAKK